VCKGCFLRAAETNLVRSVRVGQKHGAGVLNCPLCSRRRSMPVPISLLGGPGSRVCAQINELLLHRYLRLNPRVRFCPRNGCGNAVEVLISSSDCRTVVCDQCLLQFCTRCNQPWVKEHARCSCQEYQDVILASYDSTFARLTSTIRRCPHCCVFLERTSGCDHMTCSCGFEFCYRCMAEYRGHVCSNQATALALSRVPVRQLPLCTDKRALEVCSTVTVDAGCATGNTGTGGTGTGTPAAPVGCTSTEVGASGGGAGGTGSSRVRCVLTPSQDFSGTILAGGHTSVAERAFSQVLVRKQVIFLGKLAGFVGVSVASYTLIQWVVHLWVM
jgi:IBR domain, a half RING-finger domain